MTHNSPRWCMVGFVPFCDLCTLGPAKVLAPPPMRAGCLWGERGRGQVSPIQCLQNLVFENEAKMYSHYVAPAPVFCRPG